MSEKNKTIIKTIIKVYLKGRCATEVRRFDSIIAFAKREVAIRK